MFASLAGSSDIAKKTAIVRRIFAKLQELYKSDAATLRVKIKQLELLSLLRGKTIQQIIVAEENNMPVTIDITQDLRYQQGVEKGIEVGVEKGKEEGIERGKAENRNEIAEKLLQEGLSVSFIQKVTGLPAYIIEMIAQRLKA